MSFTRNIDSRRFYLYQKWERQKPPFEKPLPYTMQRANLVAESPDGDPFLDAAGQSTNRDTSTETWLVTKARDKLREKLNPQVLFSATLATAGQNVEMILKRSLQIVELVKALRKKDFKRAYRVVRGYGVRPDSSKRRLFADTWLEWSFGWKPLLKDLHEALDVLVNTEFGTRKVHAQARFARTFVNYSHSGYDNGSYVSERDVRAGVTVLRLGVKVRVSNPNLYLASQLGFVNPFALVNELIPWSFVVDWFVNVSSVLDAMTDFVGMDVSDVYSTRFTSGTTDHTKSYSYNVIYDLVPKMYKSQWVWASMERTLDLPSPSLSFRHFNGWGLTRAANALSLLVQQSVRH